jgi:hypothetical protein
LSSLYLESQFLSLGNPPYRFSLFTGCSKAEKNGATDVKTTMIIILIMAHTSRMIRSQMAGHGGRYPGLRVNAYVGCLPGFPVAN